MRDLRSTDRIREKSGRYFIETEHGCEPLCWKDLKDYARWWIRQAELNTEIQIPVEDRLLFKEILSTDEH